MRSHHENELLGLALLSLGLVLCAILYLGLDGGAVGSWLAGVLQDVLGDGAYVLPVALLALGALMLARSDLLDVRPFRLGVGVSFLGLMTLASGYLYAWLDLSSYYVMAGVAALGLAMVVFAYGLRTRNPAIGGGAHGVS